MAWGASGVKRKRRHLEAEEMNMTYRVYSGPPGTETVPPMEKQRWLYKECGLLDEALGWARHVNDGGRVALLIEGDDGTQLSKREIAATLRHPERPDRATTSAAQSH